VIKLSHVDAKILGASLRTGVPFAASRAKLRRETLEQAALSALFAYLSFYHFLFSFFSLVFFFSFLNYELFGQLG
jgi:hypothetical protein